MFFITNRTAAFVFAALTLLPTLPSRAPFAAAQTIEPLEPAPVGVSGDSSDCQELQALKTAFLERHSYTSRDDLNLSFEAALKAGENDGEVAEKLVDFVVESLIFDKDFFLFHQKILTASENESSPFHRDDLLEKLRYSVDYLVDELVVREHFGLLVVAYEAALHQHRRHL